MARSGTPEYLATADYSLGWGDNRERSSQGRGGTESEAMGHAADWSAEMRRAGAASPIRRVRVRQWRGHELSDAPLVFEVSYYDSEQALTNAEVHAARTHDWHESADRANDKAVPRNGRYFFGYAPWPAGWGSEPKSCPACGRRFSGDLSSTERPV